MNLTQHGTAPLWAVLLTLAAAGAACGGKVVSPDDDVENDVDERDSGPLRAPTPLPPVNTTDATSSSGASLDGVAANCGNANVVYADVLDATGTSVRPGERSFPVKSADSSSVNTSTIYVELSTFGGAGPNGITLTVGSTSSAAKALAVQTYAEPPDDSSGAPFLAVAIDGEGLTSLGPSSGAFAVTALAGDSPDGVLLPFGVAFDVTIATPDGPAHVVGCGRWDGS